MVLLDIISSFLESENWSSDGIWEASVKPLISISPSARVLHLKTRKPSTDCFGKHNPHKTFTHADLRVKLLLPGQLSLTVIAQKRMFLLKGLHGYNRRRTFIQPGLVEWLFCFV